MGHHTQHSDERGARVLRVPEEGRPAGNGALEEEKKGEKRPVDGALLAPLAHHHRLRALLGLGNDAIEHLLGPHSNGRRAAQEYGHEVY